MDNSNKIDADNFININGLKRVSIDSLWHPNVDFLNTLKDSGVQAYLLEGTIYGCFVNIDPKLKVKTKWFGHHTSSIESQKGKVVPNSIIDLYRVLEVCEPENLNGVIFNLDLLNGG